MLQHYWAAPLVTCMPAQANLRRQRQAGFPCQQLLSRSIKACIAVHGARGRTRTAAGGVPRRPSRAGPPPGARPAGEPPAEGAQPVAAPCTATRQDTWRDADRRQYDALVHDKYSLPHFPVVDGLSVLRISHDGPASPGSCGCTGRQMVLLLTMLAGLRQVAGPAVPPLPAGAGGRLARRPQPRRVPALRHPRLQGARLCGGEGMACEPHRALHLKLTPPPTSMH